MGKSTPPRRPARPFWRRVAKRCFVLVACPLVVITGGLVVGGLIVESVFQRPLPVIWKKADERWSHRHPVIFAVITPIANAYVSLFQDDLPRLNRPLPEMEHWRGHGASADRAVPRPGYTPEGRPLAMNQVPAGAPGDGSGRVVDVANAVALLSTLRHAQAGDQIVLQPGVYSIDSRNIRLGGTGTRERPIVVRARRLGEARLRLVSLEGFLVDEPFWVFENLDIQGVCDSHDQCEHAFHVVGRARSTTIRNNRLHDFNAMIKVNGLTVGGRAIYPDNGLIESNSFYNRSARATASPVTPIDIVAANGWVVTGNLIADFGKLLGNQTSYGAFFKGNSSGGVFERNLVICAMRLSPDQGISVGLSLGGGGSTGGSCRHDTCTPEHSNGIVKNNVIMHCSNDGIYLNKARQSMVFNNTLYNTWGIEARFAETSALVINNVYTGKITTRDGAFVDQKRNLEVGAESCFVDPANGEFQLVDSTRVVGRGTRLAAVENDFCGAPRRGYTCDVGAFEYQDQNPTCELFP